MIRKVAIIGSSIGQRPLYIKAHELGLYTIGFAWDKDAICKDVTDKFYPISIVEMDTIANICKEECVIGVVANGSLRTVEVAFYVAEQLGLNCTPYKVIQQLKNKAFIRTLTSNIEELNVVQNYIYDGKNAHFVPCVVKPTIGAGKMGVSFVNHVKDFQSAIDYAVSYSQYPILIEQYVIGKEVSVEAISYKGKHYVIQITDKDSSGAPHFVELGHHQPSSLPGEIKDKICRIIPRILDRIGFVSGATHIELKVDDDGGVYLIEVNLRGGGDRISTDLVGLSTNCDYMKAMVLVAIDEFQEPKVNNVKYSGIYYLTKQTEYLVDFFKSSKNMKWFIEGNVDSYDLIECVNNRTRNGYLIYCSDHKIMPNLD